MGNIITTNELPGEQIKAGQRLLLDKEGWRCRRTSGVMKKKVNVR
mgnify:CR=1 FL=1